DQLLERLSKHRLVGNAPKKEWEWLADHGEYRCYSSGQLIASKGVRIPEFHIVFAGRFGIHVQERVGWRRVLEWKAGDLSGMMPYSRMSGAPGDSVVDEQVEALAIHEKLFPEMILECPSVTAMAVHVMIDRARHFNTAALQDEKMMSLGKLSAGLAHELNNPAAAAMRSAQLLESALDATATASRALGGLDLTEEQEAVVEKARAICRETSATVSRSPLEQADREDEISSWLESHGADPDLAHTLADTSMTIDTFDMLADALDGEALNVTLRWLANGSGARALTRDIERATSRIHQLVSAIKRFTYMDRAQVPEPVDVGQLLEDTVAVLGSKARGKSIALKLDVEPGLPPALGLGGELNQVWLNLIDNAIDAVPNGGTVRVTARVETGWLVVRVSDNGAGIPEAVRAKIFDPFFTTKPPGQGTGLGLDIVQRVIRHHRGEIDVQSEPGKTEFRVALPLATPAAPVPAAR
ncbi:MAG TPA: ATP-binding protein, partial [Gemmatimonadaceae bacterium]|nr:ATP-binding protein [Gemmatimonadaceae bacterium]